MNKKFDILNNNQVVQYASETLNVITDKKIFNMLKQYNISIDRIERMEYVYIYVLNRKPVDIYAYKIYFVNKNIEHDSLFIDIEHFNKTIREKKLKRILND
jgi:hypothetical protein